MARHLLKKNPAASPAKRSAAFARDAPAGTLARAVAGAGSAAAVARLSALQRTANAAPLAQRAVLQRWVKKDAGLDERTLSGRTRYVDSASERVFDRNPGSGAIFGAVLGQIPQKTRLKVTRGYLAARADGTATYGVITSIPRQNPPVEQPARFVNGVINTDALSTHKPKDGPGPTPGADALGSVAEMTDPFDVAAGRFDRGALKEERDGLKVDRDPSTMSDSERAQYNADWRFKHGSEVAAGVGGGIGDLVAIGSVIHNWRARSKNERAQDMADMGATGTSLVANVTKIVDSSAKVEGGGGSSGTGNAINITDGDKTVYSTTGSDLAGKMTGNIADMVGIVASVKDAIVDGIALFKQVKAKDEASTGDVTKAAVGSLVSLLKLAKGIVTTVRNFQFTLENAFDSGVSAAVPGIGIAITGIQAILQAYETTKSITYYKKMKLRKRRLKDKVELALMEENSETGTQFVPKFGYKKKTLPVRGKKNKGRTHGEITDLLAQKKQELAAALRQGAPSTEIEARKTVIDTMQRYKMAWAFEYVNAKTARRGIAYLILSLTSIAGDLATLTGAGAGVGGGLKIAAGATKGAMVGARHLKQFGRNRAEKEKAWKITKKVFNAKKSTSAKARDRGAIADMVFDQISDLFTQYRKNKDSWSKSKHAKAKERYDEIADYVRAAGLSWKAWSAITARNPSKGHAMLVSGQKTRG